MIELTVKKLPRAASQNSEDYDRIWLKTRESADNIKDLIRSIKMSPEEKIAIEDGIDNLTRDVESMVDRIAMASSKEDRKKLVNAYRKFLEHNIEVVTKDLTR